MNNIMTAIHGYTDLALATVSPESDVGQSLLEIDRASSRATDLVRRILAFSRDTEPQRVIGDLAPVVSEAFGLLRSLIPGRIEARLRLDPLRLPARADPTQIHQIVMNLATNAIHAMPGAGSLEISLGPQHLEAPPTSGMAIGPEPTPGDWVVIEVRDTGLGIDPNVLDRIFEPFFTTRADGQGTGLGLAMVLAIARNHDGIVRVTSAPGEGSTFSVWLPAARSGATVRARTAPDLLRAPSPAREPTAIASSPSHGAHVLFVDDERVIARLATRELEREGYRVTPFTDPAAALAALRATPDAFDALITDASMPEVSGYELIATARIVRPGMPTILITGGPLNNALALRTPPPWDALLLKPAALRQLGETLARLFATRP
jgi:CheY-like chemotaxis protein